MDETPSNERRQALPPGLPKCLDGLEKLEKPLFLNRRHRRRILKTDFANRRVGDVEAANQRPGAQDRARMLALYRNPETRRELWRRHRDAPGTKEAASGPRRPSGRNQAAAALSIPPSLEYEVLRAYLEEERGQERDSEARERPSSEDDAMRRVRVRVQERLGEWAGLDDEARIKTVQQLFALATVFDDRTILEDACQQVDSLGDEFHDLLRADAEPSETPVPAPEQPEATPDAAPPGQENGALPDLDSEATEELEEAWRGKLRALAARVQTAIDRPPDTSVLDEIREIVAELDALEEPIEQAREAGAATRHLQSVAEKCITWIEDDSSSEAIAVEELERIRGAWSSVPALTPAQAQAEIERLEKEVGALLERLRQADAKHRSTEKKLDKLRANRPSEKGAIRDWEDKQDDLREQATHSRRERRAAEDAILDALVPSIQAAEPSTSTQPPVVPAEPQPRPAEDDPDDLGAEATSPPRKEESVERSETTAEPGNAGKPPVEEPPSPEPEDVQPATDEAQRVETEEQASATASRPSEATEAAAPQLSAETQAETGEPSSEARPTGPHQEAREALARALAAEPPQLAYAAQVSGLLEQLDIDAGQPRAALLEAVLYASRLDRPDGELAAEFQSAVECALETPPSGERTAASINAEALIAFAAALPAVLLAPYSGAAMLLDLTHEGLDPLYRFAQDLAARSWEIQQAHIDAATLLRVARKQATQTDAFSDLLRELEAWRSEQARLPLSYVPANKVWRALADKGELDQLIHAIQRQAGSRSVLDLVDKLSSEADLRKIVDRLSEEALSHRQSIDSKIFLQFKRRIETPLELARRYLSLESLPAGQANHRQKVIDALVSTVRDGAPALRRELAEIGDAEPDSLLAAAASVARRFLDRVEALVDPQAPFAREPEPAPDLLLASALFGFPQLRTDRAGRIVSNHSTALETLLRSTPLRLDDALEANLEQEAIGTASRILAWVESEPDGSGDVEAWEQRIDDAKRNLHELVQEKLNAVRDDLDLAFYRGQIDPNRHAEHQARLLIVENATRSDAALELSQERKDIERIKNELHAAADASRQKALAAAIREFPDSEDPQRRKIEQHVADNDLITANELIYRPRDDDAVPQRNARASRISPLLDAYLNAGREALRDFGTDWQSLRSSAENGERLGPLPYDRLDRSERLAAVALLEAWRRVKRCSQEDLKSIASAVGALLERIGFLDVDVKMEHVSRGFASADLQTVPLRSRNECPAPHFGSEAGGKYTLLVFFDPVTAEYVFQRLQQQPSKKAAIAICIEPIGKHAHRRLSQLSQEQSLSLIAIDEPLLIFLGAQPGFRLADLFACTLPFTHNQPFASRAGLVPPEMFFGRESEIQKVSNLRGSCLVYGGRQLGKTALLRHVEREYANEDQGRFAAWIDLKAEGIGDEDTSDVWPAVWRKLRQIGAIDEATRKPTKRSVAAFMDALHDRFNRRTGRTLLLLFDEADNFLRRDAMNSSRETFAESNRLKALMDRDQSIKVVFAGLHNVLRTTTQSNHPLAHLGQPIPIRPFTEGLDRRYAEDLLRHPLEACGYRFKPQQLVMSVLAIANYYPGLLQVYGAAIVNRLSRFRPDEPVKEIDLDFIETLQRNSELRDAIRQRFEWTLQLDPRYEAIAYTIASECLENHDLLHTGMNDDRILRHVREWWPVGFQEAGRDVEIFQALLGEMVELGVLRHTGDSHYSLRNPNVLLLLGGREEIDNRLGAFESRSAPPEPGPFEIRRRHGDSGGLTHRPLTLRQERRILGDSTHRLARKRNAVVLVCGLKASGICHVAEFLRWGKEPHEMKELRPTRALDSFERDLKSALEARGHGATVIIVPDDDEWGEQWVDRALDLVGNLRSSDRFARVVFTLDADRMLSRRSAVERWIEDGRVDLVALRPWDTGFAARCIDEHPEVGEKLHGKQEETLVEHAGGWPLLLDDLVLDRLCDGTPLSELIDPASFDRLLAEHAEQLRPAFGLTRPDIREALRLLKELGPVAYDDLLDPEVRSLTACKLSDEELRGIFWAAEKLRLVQTNDGEWQVDPVVGKLL